MLDWLTDKIAGSPYGWSDIHNRLTGPAAETAWRALTLPLTGFTHADRETVLRGIERRARLYPGPIPGRNIERADIGTVEASPSRRTPAAVSPFEGLPRD